MGGNYQSMTDTEIFYSIFAGGNQEGRIPERHLASAVLKRALYDFFGKDRIVAQDAEEWLFSTDPDLYEFSFVWICEQLTLDADLLLEQIKLLAAEAESGRMCMRRNFG